MADDADITLNVSAADAHITFTVTAIDAAASTSIICNANNCVAHKDNFVTADAFINIAADVAVATAVQATLDAVTGNADDAQVAILSYS